MNRRGICGKSLNRPTTTSGGRRKEKELNILPSAKLRPWTPTHISSTSSSPLSVFNFHEKNGVKAVKKKKRNSKNTKKRRFKSYPKNVGEKKVEPANSVSTGGYRKRNDLQKLKELDEKLKSKGYEDKFRRGSYTLSNYSSNGGVKCSKSLNKTKQKRRRRKVVRKEKTLSTSQKRVRKNDDNISILDSIYSGDDTPTILTYEDFETNMIPDSQKLMKSEDSAYSGVASLISSSSSSSSKSRGRNSEILQKTKMMEKLRKLDRFELEKKLDTQQSEIDNLRSLVGKIMVNSVVGNSKFNELSKKYSGIVPNELENCEESEVFCETFHGRKKIPVTNDYTGVMVFTNALTLNPGKK